MNPPQTPRPRSRGCDNARFTEGKTEAQKSKGWPTSPTWRAAALGQGPDLKGPFLCTAAYTRRAAPTGGALLLPAFHPRMCEAAFPRPGVPAREARAGEGQSDDARPQFPLCTAHTQDPADRAVTSAPDRSSLTGRVAREAPSCGANSAKPPTHLSSGRTPTHRRLRLRTAAPLGPAPQSGRLRGRNPLVLDFILRRRVNCPSRSGGSDAI